MEHIYKSQDNDKTTKSNVCRPESLLFLFFFPLHLKLCNNERQSNKDIWHYFYTLYFTSGWQNECCCVQSWVEVYGILGTKPRPVACRPPRAAVSARPPTLSFSSLRFMSWTMDTFQSFRVFILAVLPAENTHPRLRLKLLGLNFLSGEHFVIPLLIYTLFFFSYSTLFIYLYTDTVYFVCPFFPPAICKERKSHRDRDHVYIISCCCPRAV